MWGFSIINYDYNNKSELIGVTIGLDNGDAQYMTIEEYDKFIENRKKLS